MNRAEYLRDHPDHFYLDPTDVPGLEAYLVRGGRLGSGEKVRSAARAGEGNMNCVVRVETTAANTFILKQARPWVEKYPTLAAPRDRALVEENFYRLIATTPGVAGQMPRLLWVDGENRLLALADLGTARDFFPLYARDMALDGETLDTLADYLGALHSIRLTDGGPASPLLANRAMRALNHTHIFDLPMRSDNGLDLDAYTPGLAGAATPLRADPAYAARVHALGQRYLGDGGNTLLHGDFFPGSWLRTAEGSVRIIDPEFGFRGEAAFDLSTTLAHLILADQPAGLAERFLNRYDSPGGAADEETAWSLAGVEIMRRLIGVAQLPLPPDLPRKRRLLEISRQLVLEPTRGRQILREHHRP